jgi:hypothetical protein
LILLSAFDRSPRHFYQNKNKKPFSFLKYPRLKTEITLNGDSAPKERVDIVLKKKIVSSFLKNLFSVYSVEPLTLKTQFTTSGSQ